MPANLTPEYRVAEEKFKKAQTLEEKISALEEMLAKIPKHKGTEKLQADLKAKLSKLRKQATSGGGGPSRRTETYHIPKEGAGRISIVGVANTGKSTLFTVLTGVSSQVADYPFTTRTPVVGMMTFEDIKIQVIDLPAVSEQFMLNWVPQIIRLSDLILLVFDISSLDPIAQLNEPLHILKERKIELIPEYRELKEEEIGSHQSVAKIRTLVVSGFMDVDGSEEIFELLKEEAHVDFEIIPLSSITGKGVEELKRKLFRGLRINRVYSKEPGKKPSPEPFVLKKGSSVEDFAGKIHKDFVEKLEFARVWRKGEDKDGIRVSKDFILQDGDIVELHI